MVYEARSIGARFFFVVNKRYSQRISTDALRQIG